MKRPVTLIALGIFCAMVSLGCSAMTPGDVSRALDLPVLAAMRPQRGLGGALDRGAVPGQSRGPLATAARQVMAALDHADRTQGAGRSQGSAA